MLLIKTLFDMYFLALRLKYDIENKKLKYIRKKLEKLEKDEY